jgi:4-hydroxybenzoate decarboxylase subunit C
MRRAEVFCAGCLVVEGSPYTEEPNQAERLAGDPVFADWPLVILHDDATVAGSTPDFLWSTWTRFEPAADTHAAETNVVRHHLSYQSPIVIDARKKPSLPDELFARDDIKKLVDDRWREYFPG